MDTKDILIRGYSNHVANTVPDCKPNGKPPSKRNRNVSYRYRLVFDTETTTDYTQSFRFGYFKLFDKDVLKTHGLIYDADNLSVDEMVILDNYAIRHNIPLYDKQFFINEIFYKYIFLQKGLCIGFNLPFDISRLAFKYAICRKQGMRGGFNFVLSENKYLPRVHIKHLSAKSSIIKFTALPKNNFYHYHNGYFIDVKTIACALLSGSWSLDRLGKALNVTSKKKHTTEHGTTLTNRYIDYCIQDVNCTDESFIVLRDLYASYGLSQPLHYIFSEASIGKAYLKQMGIKPFDVSSFPSETLGYIMSTYYGGRSEVHIRKKSVPAIYCDFLSMYPTVCTLMGLWDYVIADSIKITKSDNNTLGIKNLLDIISSDTMLNKKYWPILASIVKVKPDGDIFPIRSTYDDVSTSIGLNYLTSEKPLWFTLADCIASKLLTGQTPEILDAISFLPNQPQADLQPINIAGNDAYHVNPYEQDFYKTLIELRKQIQQKKRTSINDLEKQRYENDQLACKITANATSYGIFVELNVEEYTQVQELEVYANNATPFTTLSKNVENRGKYFNPLIATLITGAARLMLAIAECTAKHHKLSWVYCDTDSMCLTPAFTSNDEEFKFHADAVVKEFDNLNPYNFDAQLFKFEDENYKDGVFSPLHCYAISAKRVCLYNKTDDDIEIRKFSSHGLGHLFKPYGNGDDWHKDYWYHLLTDTLDVYWKKLNIPAITRYTASTPELIKWFANYNDDKLYNEQVKPFNFLVVGYNNHLDTHNHPIALFDNNVSTIIKSFIDKDTHTPLQRDELKTYVSMLQDYDIHPESKFLGGGYLESGTLQRRHILVNKVIIIGKESNKLEKRYYLGDTCETDNVVFGEHTDDTELAYVQFVNSIKGIPCKVLARYSMLSDTAIRGIIHGTTRARGTTLAKVYDGYTRYLLENDTRKNRLDACIKQLFSIHKYTSYSIMSDKIGVSHTSLSLAVNGKRTVSENLLSKMERFIENEKTEK